MISNEVIATAQQAAPRLSIISPQWKEMKRRARALAITPVELEACETIEQFHTLVKRKYRIRLKQVHPDGNIHDNPHKVKYGATLKVVLRANKWLMGLTPEMFRRTMQNRSTAPEFELPLDWGVGWTEYDRRYDGFTILPRL